NIGQVILMLLAIFWVSAGGPGQTEMQFHPGRGIGGQGEMVPFSGRSKSQSLRLVVLHAAEFLSHQRGKERINEIQYGLVTAEIVRQCEDMAGGDKTHPRPFQWRGGRTIRAADSPSL